MTIPSYAGGIFLHTEFEGEQYVLLGKCAYEKKRGVHDIFSAKRNSDYDGTPHEEMLEESLATKFEQETLGVCMTGKEAYDALVPASTKTVTLMRQARDSNYLEYKVYSLFLKSQPEDVRHLEAAPTCRCIPCKFEKAHRHAPGDHPIQSLAWIKLKTLFRVFLGQQGDLLNGKRVELKLRDVLYTFAHSAEFSKSVICLSDPRIRDLN